MSLIYKEHKFLKKRIEILEKKIKKLERELNAKRKYR
jgi:prefoldin subunit 5